MKRTEILRTAALYKELMEEYKLQCTCDRDRRKKKVDLVSAWSGNPEMMFSKVVHDKDFLYKST